MFKESCPGSREIRTPYPEEVKCFRCNTVNEIWTDEVDADCKQCGKKLSREMQPSCIEWCPAAKDCIGAEKYDRLITARKKQEVKN